MSLELCKEVLPKVDPDSNTRYPESTPKKSFSNIHDRSIYLIWFG